MIGVTAAASAGIYLHRGYIDPGLAMPVVLGVLGGSRCGALASSRVRRRGGWKIFMWVIVVWRWRCWPTASPESCDERQDVRRLDRSAIRCRARRRAPCRGIAVGDGRRMRRRGVSGTPRVSASRLSGVPGRTGSAADGHGHRRRLERGSTDAASIQLRAAAADRHTHCAWCFGVRVRQTTRLAVNRDDPRRPVPSDLQSDHQVTVAASADVREQACITHRTDLNAHAGRSI